MKVVLNKCHGGFSLSDEVYEELGIRNNPENSFRDYDKRSNPELIAAIEKIGVEKSSGANAELVIVDIPDYITYYIRDYDGYETAIETHSSW